MGGGGGGGELDKTSYQWRKPGGGGLAKKSLI